jgi:hypothetical protein
MMRNVRVRCSKLVVEIDSDIKFGNYYGFYFCIVYITKDNEIQFPMSV